MYLIACHLMGYSIVYDTTCGTLKTCYGKMGLKIRTLQNGIFIHRVCVA